MGEVSISGDKARELATALDARDKAVDDTLVLLATSITALTARVAKLEAPVVVPPVVPPATTLTPLSADPIVSIAKPAVGVPIKDPTYGLTLIRAASGSRPYYSRRSPWNASRKYFITWDGSKWFLHDAVTYAKLREIAGLAANMDVMWHPTDPKRLLHTGKDGAGGIWYWLDVETGARVMAFNLTGTYAGATHYWTGGEGRLSDDGRYLAVMALAGTKCYGLVVVDTVSGQVVSKLNTTNKPDHVTMSKTGLFVVPQFLKGQGGIIAYKRDFSGFTQIHDKTEHADCGLSGGRDVHVYMDYSAGKIRAKFMDTGVWWDVAPIYQANSSSYVAHISCTGPADRVLISTSDDSEQGGAATTTILQPQYRKVWLAELKPAGKSWNLVHIRGTGTSYMDEPQASLSPDGKRAMFASNQGSGYSDAYVVEIP